MSEDFTVETARAAAADGNVAEWVQRFLCSPGSDNPVLAEALTESDRTWHGPVQLPFDQLHRLSGPPEDPVLCPVDDEDWGSDVDEMAEQIAEGWEPPPVIVTYRDDQLVLEDGNHRVEALRRAGRREAWALVAFDSAEDRDRYEARVLGEAS